MSSSVRYSVTGVVASDRISPLVPSDWINTTESPEVVPDFLWENAPRRETKDYRDSVKVYSHLPNGTSVLDSKWALGRLFSSVDKKKKDQDPLLANLETYCFRGLDGFQAFAKKVKLLNEDEDVDPTERSADDVHFVTSASDYPDIMNKANLDLSLAPDVDKGPSNLWVVKDAMANGAGGIWVVGPETAASLASEESTPLYPEHRYVAQRYVWPPVLFGGRKCHVRVYGLLTSDGRAFVHHRAFLHVANDAFTTSDANQTGSFQDSIHITNCCANSHDDTKFAGEILADFETTEYTERDGQTVVPLAAFFPSVQKCISFLAEQAFPFLQGGQANHGFEYMGIDFMLSYNHAKDPVAYILEINAPPSQDSATGLPHAENLHNEVIRDLTTLWVLPHVTNAAINPGGWRCVHLMPDMSDSSGELIAPSKATIINKIRWSMFEKKAQRQEDEAQNAENGTNSQTSNIDDQDNTIQGHDISCYARSQFPFFSDAASCRTVPQVFFENAGGSQVAQHVIDAVCESLRCRNRVVVGTRTKSEARNTLRKLLGTRDNDLMVLGPNATTLLASLADKYVQCGLLSVTDEIILSTENHCANFDPWVRAAKESGATLKLWTPFGTPGPTEVDNTICSSQLAELVTPATRIVAIPHASNVLGQIRDLESLSSLIKAQSEGYADIVVDGVAAVPHYFADLKHHRNVDWYAISCHKLFGPHLGALYGSRRGAVAHFAHATGSSPGAVDDDALLHQLFESGTINYEACAGVVGLGRYLVSLATFSAGPSKDDSSLNITPSFFRREMLRGRCFGTIPGQVR